MNYLIIFILIISFAGCANNQTVSVAEEKSPQLVIVPNDNELNNDVIFQKVENQNAALKKIETIPLKMEIKKSDHFKMQSLDLRYSKKLYDFWINYLSSRFKDSFQKHLDNSLIHKETVTRILSLYNLPKDLFYVGLIESGYNMRIRSRAGASGPWQFMKATARHYGLKINNRVDDRNDLIKSTHAACKYFKDLYNIFGSWEFALLAYNKGEYGVIRAIRRGNSRDYRELVAQKLLPSETIYYIPKIVAARDVFNDMGKYGFVKSAKMNKGQDILPKTQEKQVVVASQNDVYKKHLTYRVKKGDTLSSLTQKYHVSIKDLRALNPRMSYRLYSNQQIKIPVNVSYYTVKKGDSLLIIAQKFGLSVGKILSYNSLDSEKIYPRQKLVIPILL